MFTVNDSAWVPLLISTIILSIILIWNYGEHKLKNWKLLNEPKVKWEEFVKQLSMSKHSAQKDSQETLYDLHFKFDAEEIVTVDVTPGIGIFLTDDLEVVPPAVFVFMQRLGTLPEAIVAMKLVTTNFSTIAQKDRITIIKSYSNIVVVEIFVGFAEKKLDITPLVKKVMTHLLTKKQCKSNLSFHSCLEAIEVISPFPYNLPLELYQLLKQLFPLCEHRVDIEVGCSVVLIHTYKL